LAYDYDTAALASLLGNNINQNNQSAQSWFETENATDQQLIGINNVLVGQADTSSYGYAVRSRTLGSSTVSGSVVYPFYLDHPSLPYGDIDGASTYFDGDFRTTALIASGNI
jgi:hypothetical protein